MTTTPICILDTETTGLRPDDEIWEFFGRRREADGTSTDLHLFIEHDKSKAQQLPASFFADYKDRCPNKPIPREVAAKAIQDFTLGAHLVGANPAFDAEKLAILLRAHGLEPKWNYHLIDIETVVLGYLLASRADVGVPWRSEELSKELGVHPAAFERHTAQGDVSWVEAQFDFVMKGGPAGA